MLRMLSLTTVLTFLLLVASSGLSQEADTPEGATSERSDREAIQSAGADQGSATGASDENAGGEQPQDPIATVTLDPVIVTATRSETDLLDLAADAWVIDEKHLRSPGAQNVREALQHIPGVQLNQRQENGMFIGGIEIRGLSSNLTSGGNALILLDGIPQRRLSFGGPYMGAIPFEAVERAELIKGPLSSLYGRGSLAGALQLFTHKGSDTFGVRTRSVYDSASSMFRQAISLDGPLASLGEEATFSLTTTISDADGWQDDTDSQKRDVYLHLDTPLGERDRIEWIGGFFDGFENVPAPVPIDNNGDPIAGLDRKSNLAVPNRNSLDLEEARLGAHWIHEFSPQTESKLTVAYWRAETDWLVGRPQARPAGTILNRPARILDWEEESIFLAPQVQHETALGDDIDWTLTAGGSVELMKWDQSFTPISTPSSTFREGIPIDLSTMVEPDPATFVFGNPTVRETEETHYGLFLQNQFAVWERLTLDAGVRVDGFKREQKNETTGIKGSNDDIFVSPRAGLAYRLVDEEATALTAYTSWSRGFNPVFRQVATNEVVDVDPESSSSYEIGLRGNFLDGLLDATMAVYRIDREDVVAFNPAASTFQNTGDWRVDGVEIGAVLHPWDAVDLFANYTHRSPTIERDVVNPANRGNDLVLVARNLATVGIRGFLENLGLGGELRARIVGDSYQDFANTIKSPSYVLLDASATYRLSEQVRFSVFGRNLLDEEYHADTFTVPGTAFFGTGASVGLELGLRF